MEEGTALAAAFVAGLLSFFSPYVLPLIPGYLSYISGLSLDEIRGTKAGTGASGVALATPAEARRRVVTTSLAFCLGFSAVFVALGASAGAVGEFVTEQQMLLEKIGGAIVIGFGLQTLGVLRLPWFGHPKRVRAKKPPGLAGALFVGVAFAVGWTPCLGPILAGMLAVALIEDSLQQGARLLGGFSLGLALPFMGASLALNRYFTAFVRIRRHFPVVELATGAFLVLLGVLIFTSRFTQVA